ncbi:MAG: folate-binding protein YgfZ [Proteobacteria bacterium]|nr:folate-binding protein YgfZ [Pseudomonadota bacterium]
MFLTNLIHRGVIEIEGEDRAEFLQGLITNDVNLITPTQAIYAALLTPQGRFLYDLFIVENENSYFLDVERDRLEALLKKLTLYKLRSHVTLKSRPDLKVYALWDERPISDDYAGMLQPLPESRNDDSVLHSEERCSETIQEIIQKACDVYPDPRLSTLGARIMVENLQETATPRDYDLHRLILGIPEGGRDLIPEKTILLEAGLDDLNVISWTKGCYMGQELTARTKYRGLVRKRLFPVIIEGDAPAEGSEIFLDRKPVGEMRTSNSGYGLALLRLEAREANGELLCGNARLKPYTPGWMRFEDPS